MVLFRVVLRFTCRVLQELPRLLLLLVRLLLGSWIRLNWMLSIVRMLLLLVIIRLILLLLVKVLMRLFCKVIIILLPCVLGVMGGR